MRMVLPLLLASSLCLAAEPPPIPQRKNFENPDKAFSIGINLYRSPLDGAQMGSINDKSLMLDIIMPVSPRISLNASYGQREQTWNFATSQKFDGRAYSVGLRLYLDDPYSE